MTLVIDVLLMVQHTRDILVSSCGEYLSRTSYLTSVAQSGDVDFFFCLRGRVLQKGSGWVLF